jgi:hypothetical protein
LHAIDDDDQEENELDEDNLPLSTFKVGKTESFADIYLGEDTKHEISDHTQTDCNDDIPNYTETISLNDPTRLDEVRLRLMSIYKHYEMLWNSKHKLYNRTVLRLKSIEAIAEQANIKDLTVEETKIQIRNTRRLYRKILNEKKDNELTGEKEKICFPKWFYVADSYLPLTGTSHEVQATETEDIPEYTEMIYLNDLSRLDDIRLRLISLYKHYELLWNFKHLNYKAMRIRHKTWQILVEQANIEDLTVEKAKLEIRTMRKLHRIIFKEKTEYAKNGIKEIHCQPDWFYLADFFLAPTEDTSYVDTEDTKNEGNPQHTEVIKLSDSGWLNKIRLRLITLYKNYELLWNAKHKYFSSTRQRNKAWMQFAEQAKTVEDLTFEESKNQILAIRRMYRKISKKIKCDEAAGKMVSRQADWYYVAESCFGPARTATSTSAKPTERLQRTPNADHDLLQSDEVLPIFIAVAGNADDFQIKKEDPDLVKELTDTCCRSCLQEYHNNKSSLKSLTATIIDGVLLQQIYNECVGSAYDDVDNVLPNSICKSCFHLVVDFYQFRNKCLVNEMKFLVAKNVDLQKKPKEIAASCPSQPLNNAQQLTVNDDDDDSFTNFESTAFVDDDSITCEETPIVDNKQVHPKIEKDEPTASTSTVNFEDLINKEMETTSKMAKNVDKKIVEVRFGKKRESLLQTVMAAKKSKSTVADEISPVEPVKEVTITEDAKKFTALDFDGEELGFDNFFDDVCNESEPIDVSLIVKHDKVITEEIANSEVREKKKKPAEQVEKEELMFADYLKEMLEEAKINPCVSFFCHFSLSFYKKRKKIV